jgi:cytoskeleton protein RodZ
MASGIGDRLQNARTARGLSLDDVEAATRIRRRYLDAIEREAWEELPAPVYARSFLAAYARQLGIPPDEVLGQYSSAEASGAASHGTAPVEVRITPGAAPSRLRRILTAVVAVLIAAALVVTWVLVGQLRQFAATRPRPGATVVPHTGAPSATPGTPPPSASTSAPPAAPAPGAQASTATSPGGAASPAPGAGAPPAGTAPAPVSPGAPPAPASPGTVPTPASPGTLVITADANDRTWVRVVSDGSVVFEGFVSAGDHETWQGRQVSIRVGNASALDISVNGKPIGRLGNPGDVVDRTFSANPAATPSAPPGTPSTAAPAVPRAPVTAPASPAPPANPPAGPNPGGHG